SPNMIQRYLLRQSRAILPTLQPLSRPSSASSSPLSSPRLPITSSFLRSTAPRYYSTIPAEADTSANSEPPIFDQTKSKANEEQEQDPSKKELEAKTRDIIDLKVRLATSPITPRPIPNEENLTVDAHTQREEEKRTVVDSLDKYLRSVADFRNLQDRTKRDIQAARDFAISRFANDLMESVDNLDRALSTVPAERLSSHHPVNDSSSSDENKALFDLYQGLKMTETILMQTLKKHGLERFDPSENGARFDPRLHEATFQTKDEGKEDGEVVMVQQKGFMLNGRVIRAAKVGVVKN
ncbi:Mitochondrial matrix cochaperone, partial [Sticta canariensis]|nr:Mitochondrial matrix cochaperone [Sticta canariensis]